MDTEDALKFILAELQDLRMDVRGIQHNIQELNVRVTELTGKVERLDTRVSELDEDSRNLRLTQFEVKIDNLSKELQGHFDSLNKKLDEQHEMYLNFVI